MVRTRNPASPAFRYLFRFSVLFAVICCNPYARMCYNAEATAPTPMDRGTYAELEPEDLKRAEADLIYMKTSQATTVIFKHVKTLAGPVGYGHLVFELDLTRQRYIKEAVFTMIDSLTAQIKTGEYANASLYSYSFQPALQELLKSVNDSFSHKSAEWEGIREIFTPPSFRESWLVEEQRQAKIASTMTKRSKRGVLTAVGMFISAIVGGVGGLFTTGQLSSMSRFDEAEKTFIVETLQALHVNFTLLDAFTLHLDESVKSLWKQSIETRGRTLLAEYDRWFTRYLLQYQQEVDKAARGLESLMDKRITPSLVSVHEMETAIKQLIILAEKKTYSLPSEMPVYIYQLEAGFVLVRPDVLHISVHVPLFKQSETMKLYEAITMPMILPHSRHNLEVQLESQMLAVRDKGHGFKLMNPWQLTACTVMAGIYFCPGEDHQLKDFRDYCISALFHEPLEVSRVCRASLIPPQVKVVQLEPRTFQVFHPVPLTLHSACTEGAEPDKTFNGTQKVILKALKRPWYLVLF